MRTGTGLLLAALLCACSTPTDETTTGATESATETTTPATETTTAPTTSTTEGPTGSGSTGAACTLLEPRVFDIAEESETLVAFCDGTYEFYGRSDGIEILRCQDPMCNTCTNENLVPLDALPAGAVPEGVCVHGFHESVNAGNDCMTTGLVIWDSPDPGPALVIASGGVITAPDALAANGLSDLDVNVGAVEDTCTCDDAIDGCCDGETTRLSVEFTPEGGGPIEVIPGNLAALEYDGASYTADVYRAHRGDLCGTPKDLVDWVLTLD